MRLVPENPGVPYGAACCVLRAANARLRELSKLRIKVSGCMRSMTGAENFCAIRSYLATTARHGIGWLGALTRTAEGSPWIPGIT
ncbi:MAG: transposase [Trebonia sp.]|nr:transposase [Trebonia sp.]